MPAMKRALTIIGLLAFVCTVTGADRWIRIQSKNFVLVGNASASQIRGVAENLELFRASYSKFFSVRDNPPSVATTVVVFKTNDSFRPFKPLYQGKPANLAGYYQSGEDMNVIALSADIQTPRVIYHEYLHSLMSDNLASLPPWFQEGFAECFSTFEIEGSRRIRMGRAIPEHVALLNERRVMPLERLFAVTHESPEYNEEEKQGVFYAESWALVHYMMLGPADRRAKFFEFIDGLNKGVPAPVVFERVFQTDLASFQKTFEAYIHQRLTWPTMELSTPGALERNRDLLERTLSEAESETYLGDLLMRSERFDDAEERLKRALQLNPLLASAHAAMGQLLLRQENAGDAVGYFQRAVELDPTNHLAHYYFASSIEGRSRRLSDADWNLARSELLKSVELAPHFVAATQMLANLNLSRNAEIPQTVELLRRARTYAPGNETLAVILAFALARTTERDAAREMAEEALRSGSLSAPMRRNAESVLSYLKQTTASANTTRIPAGEASPPANSVRIRGVFTMLECGVGGITLSLNVDGRVLKFHSESAETVRFITANPSVGSSLACGPMPGPGIAATVVYRPQQSDGSMGEPLLVELGEP
jgi:tetratricopeptide (TPR) repeat protein